MAIDSVLNNLSKVNYTNLVNYMKLDPTSGTDICPSLAVSGTSTKTITHNLGYIPHIEVYQERSPGGAIVNAQLQVVGSMGTGSVTMDYPCAMDYIHLLGGYIYVTTTQLVITFANNTASTSSSFQYWWRIYLQYGGLS